MTAFCGAAHCASQDALARAIKHNAASSPKTTRSWGAPRAGKLGMIAKLLLQNLIWVAGRGALYWPAAWVFLGTIAILGVACGLWLARTDPALLAERMHPMMQHDQPAADKKFMLG